MHRREVDEARPGGKMVPHPLGDRERQARLPDTARPGQRDQANLATPQQGLERSEVAVAPDQGRRLTGDGQLRRGGARFDS